MNDAAPDIRRMHEAYCRATGFQLPLDMGRERAWFELWSRGVRVADVLLVIERIKGQIRLQKRNDGALKFRNLVYNTDFFEEDLAEARARARVQLPNAGRAAVLRATGRPEAPPPPPARAAGEVVSAKPGVPITDVIAAMRRAANSKGDK